MPYITQTERRYLGKPGSVPLTAGQLNYVITRLLQEFLGETPNYRLFNEAIGALEAAKLELYRRMVAPYEDKKIKENGDVYKKKRGKR